MTREFSPPTELVMAAAAFVADPGERGRLQAAIAGVAGLQLPTLQAQLAVAAERGLAAPPGDRAHVVAGIREILASLAPAPASAPMQRPAPAVDAATAERRRRAAAATWSTRRDLA